MNNKVTEYPVPKGEVFDSRDKGIGNYTLIGHNGGDDVLRRMLFTGDIPDTYNQIAGLQEGLMSVIPGIAAVRSIEQKKVINIRDLISTE